MHWLEVQFNGLVECGPGSVTGEDEPEFEIDPLALAIPGLLDAEPPQEKSGAISINNASASSARHPAAQCAAQSPLDPDDLHLAAALPLTAIPGPTAEPQRHDGSVFLSPTLDKRMGPCPSGRLRRYASSRRNIGSIRDDFRQGSVFRFLPILKSQRESLGTKKRRGARDGAIFFCCDA